MNIVEMNEGLNTWHGERFLELVDSQLQGKYLPFTQYPKVIEFEINNPVTQGFRQMEKDQAEGIKDIQADHKLEEYIWNESHIQLSKRKDGTWRLTELLRGGNGEVSRNAVDEIWDNIDQFAIHFHNHAYHPQIVRFFSTPDLLGTVSNRNPNIGANSPRVECVVTPGVNFLVIATKDTPELSEEEINNQLSFDETNMDKWRVEIKVTSDRLQEIGGQNAQQNLIHKDTLPRIESDGSFFDPQLSEYGISLTNYIHVLSVAHKLNLAVYCAKSGSNRFVRIDERFNPGDKL